MATAVLDTIGARVFGTLWDRLVVWAVSYTQLTLPTKRTEALLLGS